MAAVTIFALISWWFTPETAWLPKTRIANFIDSKGEGDLLDANKQIVLMKTPNLAAAELHVGKL